MPSIVITATVPQATRIAAYQLGLSLLLLCSTAQAQQPQRISDEQIDATVNAISQQRNAAQDQVASLIGRLAVLEKALKEAQGKECKPEKKG